MPLIIFFFILFAVPYIELSLFIEVGGSVGVINTILLCMLTAFIGVVLIHKQGLETLTSAREKIGQDVLPEEELWHGAALILSGLCLLIPGFFTDTIGFLLLIPPFRILLFKRFSRWDTKRSFIFIQKGQQAKQQDDTSSYTIEGEYQKIDDDR